MPKMTTNFYSRLDVITVIFYIFVAADCLKTEFGGNSDLYKYDAGKQLNKRAITQAAKLKGLAAARKLLSDTTPTKAVSKGFRKYYKSGDTSTALQDFHSVKPVNVQRKSRYHFGKGRAEETSIEGHIGDRKLILRPSGAYRNSYPVIEIRTPTDPIYDIIVYKKPKQK